MFQTSVLFTLSLLAMLTLSGCGGDSSKSTGPSADDFAPPAAAVPQAPPPPPPAPVVVNQAPIIRGWRAARNATVVIVQLDTYDPQGDLFGGSIHVTVQGSPELGQMLSGPCCKLIPGTNPNDPENDVFVGVQAKPGYVIPSGILIRFTASVTDRAGHTSNTISGSFVTEGVAGQGTGGTLPPLEVNATTLGR